MQPAPSHDLPMSTNSCLVRQWGHRCKSHIPGFLWIKTPHKWAPIWVFPKIGVGPQNGWFIMENPIRILLKWMIWGYPIFGNTYFSTSGLGEFWFSNIAHASEDLWELAWCLLCLRNLDKRLQKRTKESPLWAEGHFFGWVKGSFSIAHHQKEKSLSLYVYNCIHIRALTCDNAM